jgi:hypothetical protein
MNRRATALAGARSSGDKRVSSPIADILGVFALALTAAIADDVWSEIKRRATIKRRS